IGIKQPISAILTAAEDNDADVIGMSGLLVKSTVVMRDNLSELNSRGVAGRWPVLLGGAALTRAYVEQDLAALYEGEVRYARDAFEGLRLMDAVVSYKAALAAAGDGRPAPTLADVLPARRERVVRSVARPDETPADAMPARSDVAVDNTVPAPPFWG